MGVSPVNHRNRTPRGVECAFLLLSHADTGKKTPTGARRHPHLLLDKPYARHLRGGLV
jgi:hypothetical protein